MSRRSGNAESSARRGRRRSLPPQQPVCYCASLRQIARVMTQRYDRYLKPSGLNTAQFSLMRAIDTRPGIRTADLGDAMLIDASTLSRNLASLRDAGWLEEQDAPDGRERRWALSPEGGRRLGIAGPLWQRAQSETDRLGGAASMRRLSRTVFELAAKLAD